jgi:hypothetical protein
MTYENSDGESIQESEEKSLTDYSSFKGKKYSKIEDTPMEVNLKELTLLEKISLQAKKALEPKKNETRNNQNKSNTEPTKYGNSRVIRNRIRSE